MVIPGLEQAKTRVQNKMLDGEKHRATVEQPTGNLNSQFVQTQIIPAIGQGVSDDDFFHLTCHLDPNLIHKIENGEFIELEKLLPKDKISKNEENRLEWVQREGGTYLVPAHKDQKITSFRKWEQAFRIYATIYCGANPNRSREIWQYVSVINTASTAFYWQNVYNYDITFRHLMAFNPSRSWAVCYHQMWNLSMRDPLPKNQKSGSNYVSHMTSGSNYSYGSNNNHNNHNSTGGSIKRKKSDYCWNFNKDVPFRFGKKCCFIERCSYCDSPSHPIVRCTKAKKNGSDAPSQRGNAGAEAASTQH